MSSVVNGGAMEERRTGERRQVDRRKPWGMTEKEAWAVSREIESLLGGEATPQPFRNRQGGYRLSYVIRGDRISSAVVDTVAEALAFAASVGRYPKPGGV